MLTFKKATKTSARLRLALLGPAGSGKTYSALAIAAGLGQRIAVIDTEHGSASKYADRFGFDVLELTAFAPRTYVEALAAAEAEGYDVIVVDSLSHAWMGKDGALEQVDRKASGGKGNSFDAWRSVTPQHNALVEAMLRCRAHLLVTMRVKTDYIVEEDSRGKKVPRKVGLAPVQRDGLEYEFDVVLDVSPDHVATVSKTRCPDLTDQAFDRPGADLARILKAWLSDGPAPSPRPSPALARLLGELAAAQTVDAIVTAWRGSSAARSAMARDEQRSAWNAAVQAAAALGVDEATLRERLAGGGETPPSTPAAPPPGPLDAFNAALGEMQLPGEGVAVWRRFRGKLAPLDPALREEAWGALCARVEQVGKMANAKVWLKKAIAEEDARSGTSPDDDPSPGPQGGARGHRAAHEVVGSTAPLHAPAAAPQALVAVPDWAATQETLRAHVAGYTHRVAVERGARKWGRVVPGIAPVLVERLEALSEPDHDGTRPTRAYLSDLVASWTREGQRPAQRVVRGGRVA